MPSAPLRASAALLALGLAACGERLRPCEVPATDVSVWETVTRPHAVFRLPPGYAPDTASLAAGAEGPGSDAASWAMGPATEGVPAGRIVFQRAAEVPVPAAPAPEDGTPLPGFARCTLGEGPGRAVVSFGWMVDSLSATGRSFQTTAVWSDAGGGMQAGLYLVGETPAEQQRQLAAAASLRLR
jgi:hypothetical protein